LWFLCLAVIVSWAIIVGVLVPLNFLATEVNSNDQSEVINNAGDPLAIRQSVGIATDFECTIDFLTQLQFLFLTETRKEAVLAVELLPPIIDPITGATQNVASVQTITGVYAIPCVVESSKRNIHKKTINSAGQISQNCGNGKVDPDEQCDKKFDDNCGWGCVCNPGWSKGFGGSGNCATLCGNGVVNAPEQCDSTTGCDSNCQCQDGYVPSDAVPVLNLNGTATSHNITGCLATNPCERYPRDGAQCSWDGVHVDDRGVSYRCLRGYALWRSGYEDQPSSCQDIDECAEDPVPCPPQSKCKNTIGSFLCGFGF